MSHEPTKRGRAIQVLHWLQWRFPTERPVFIRFVRKIPGGDYGDITTDEERHTIRINTSRNQSKGDFNESVIHEYAHAIQFERHWRTLGQKKTHGRTWSDPYGQMYSRFNDEGGSEESKTL